MAESGSGGLAAGAWVLIPTQDVPLRWASRSIMLSLVPLAPEESTQLLEHGKASPLFSADEEQLAALIAEGLSMHAIARRLHVSPRTVYRRTADLRKKLKEPDTRQLALRLSRLGF